MVGFVIVSQPGNLKKNNFPINLQLINYENLFRDTFLYAASVDSRGLDATVEILGDVVLRPQITDDELKMVFYLQFNIFLKIFDCQKSYLFLELLHKVKEI